MLLNSFEAAFAPAFAQDVLADGRTATGVTTQGSFTDVTTATVAGGLGINSFSQFGVGAGQTVNLIVPDGAGGTLNVVQGGQSVINGTLQSLQGGTVGGALYLANPDGVVVGAGGQVLAGSVAISTPTRQAIDDMFGADGINPAAIANGAAAQTGAGITIAGQVVATDAVTLQTGGDITVSGDVIAGHRNLVAAGVNTGTVRLTAGNTVAVSGQVAAGRGADGGRVALRGQTIVVQAGAVIAADGIGQGAGGVVDLFGTDAAVLEAGAVLSASALGTGDGGFVELSAGDTVRIAGDMQAFARAGRAGTILVDPYNLDITANVTSNGENRIFEAENRITVANGVSISSRNVDAAGQSVGDSGDLTFAAAHIEVGQGAVIDAHADGGFQGGDVLLQAQIIDDSAGVNNVLPVGNVSIQMDGATVLGRNVTLNATVIKDNEVRAGDAVTALGAAASDRIGIDQVTGMITATAAALAARAEAVVTAADVANLPAYLSAHARVEVRDSLIRAASDVTIGTDARTLVDIAPEGDAVAIAVAGTNTVAETMVAGSEISAGHDIAVSATTTERQTLVARSDQTDPDGLLADVVDANVALAASFRHADATAVVTGGAGLSAGNAVQVHAGATKDLTIDATALTNAEGRGQAMALSVEDGTVTAALGTAVETGAGKFALTATTDIETLSITALTTGADITADITADTLNAVTGAAQAEYGAALQGAMGDLAAGVAGDPAAAQLSGADRLAGAMAISHHATDTTALLGGDAQFTAPISGIPAALGDASISVNGLSGPNAGQSGAINLNAPATGVTVKAELTLGDLRQDASVSVDNADTGAGAAIMGALTLAHWGVDTTAWADAAQIVAQVPVSITAKNILPDQALQILTDRLWGDYAAGLLDPAVAGNSALSNWANGQAPLLTDANGRPVNLFTAATVSRGTAGATGISAGALTGHLNAVAETGAGFSYRPNTVYDLSQPYWSQGFEVAPLDIAITASNSGDWSLGIGRPGLASDTALSGTGGAVGLMVMGVTASAGLGAGGQVIGADSVVVSATQDVLLTNSVRSYGAAGAGDGIGGAVAITLVDATTAALAQSGATLRLFGDLDISALDQSDIFTIAGSGSRAGGQSLDFGVAITDADRATSAGIESHGTAAVNSGADRLLVSATTTGTVATVGTASAAQGSDPGSGEQGQVALSAAQLGEVSGNLDTATGGGATTGAVTIAGDFAGAFGSVSTRALLGDITLTTGFSSDTDITARTDLTWGTASALTAVSVDGHALSGALGLSAVSQTTEISVDSARLFVDAKDDVTGGHDTYLAEDSSAVETYLTGTSGHAGDGWTMAAAAAYADYDFSTGIDMADAMIGVYATRTPDFTLSAPDVQIEMGRQIDLHAYTTATVDQTALLSRDVTGADVDASESGASGALFSDAGDAAASGGGFDGLTVAVAPLSVGSHAAISLDRTTLQADQIGALQSVGIDDDQGRIELETLAHTDVTVGGTTDDFATAIAITDTTSTVDIDASTLNAEGDGAIWVFATTRETLDLTAATSSESPLQVAGVAAIRSATNTITVDDGAAGQGSVLTAAETMINALNSQDILLSATVDDGSDRVRAGAMALSFAKGAVAADIGGRVDGKLTVAAFDLTTRDSVSSTVTSGDFAETGADTAFTPLPPGSVLLGQGLVDLADTLDAQATETTSAPWGARTSFGLGLVVDVADTAVSARANVDTAADGAAQDLTVSAASDLTDIDRSATVALANAAGSGLAASGIVVFGSRDSSVSATLGRDTKALGDVTVSAETRLPDADRSRLDGLMSTVGRSYAQGTEGSDLGLLDLAPHAGYLIDADDVSFGTHGAVNQLGGDYALDALILSFGLTTSATVDDGASLRTDDIEVSALASGTLASSRSLAELGNADDQAAKAGAGGAVQALLVTADTTAHIGALSAADVDDVTVTAANDITASANAISFGNARELAFSGAVAVVDYDGSVTATLDAGTAWDADHVTLNATEGSDAIVAAAAAQTATSAGVGIAAALAFVDRDVTAGIVAGTAQGAAAEFVALDIAALANGLTVVTADAGGALPKDDVKVVIEGEHNLPDMVVQHRGNQYRNQLKEQGTPDETEGDAAGGTFGLGVSADYAGAFTTSTVSAVLDGSLSIASSDVKITAIDDTGAIVAAGATVGGAGTVGLGGAAAHLVADRSITALVDGVDITLGAGNGILPGARGFDLWAKDTSDSRVLAAGRAGNTLKASVLGSAALAQTNSAIRAALVGGTVTGASAPAIVGSSLSTSVVAAGAVTLDVTEASDDDLLTEILDAVLGDSLIGGDDPQPGVSVGLAFAMQDSTRETRVEVDGATIDATGQITLSATSSDIDVAAAKSNGISGKLAVAGSSTLQLGDVTTAIAVNNANLTSDDGILVNALDQSILRARIASDSTGDAFAMGGTAIVMVDARSIETQIDKSSLNVQATEFGPELLVGAINLVTLDAYQAGGLAVTTGFAADLAAGVITTDWLALTRVTDSTLVSPYYTNIFASESGHILNQQGALADIGKGGGTIGTLATYIDTSSITEVTRTSLTTENTAYINSSSNTHVETKAVRNGQADAGAVMVGSLTKSSGETRTDVSGLTFTGMGLNIAANDAGLRDLVATAAASSAALGITGALVTDIYLRNTVTNLTDSTIDLIGSPDQTAVLDVAAYSANTASAVAVGRANGGEKIGTAAVLVWAKDDRDVLATLSGTSVTGIDPTTDFYYVTVEAGRDDANLLLQATLTESATGVGIGAGVLLTGGATNAIVSNGHIDLPEGGLSVNATNAAKAISVALGAADGSAFGALGSLAYLDLGKTPTQVLLPDSHGDAGRAAADTAQSDLADIVAAQVNETNASLETTRDTEIVARVTYTSSEQVNTLDITANDSRDGYAISGALQAGIMGEALDTVENFVTVTNIDYQGFSVDFFPLTFFDNEAGDGPQTSNESYDEVLAGFAPTTGEQNSTAAIETFADTTTTAEGAPKGNLSIGASVAWARTGGAVLAELVLENDAVLQAGYVQVYAANYATTLAMASGADVGGSANLGAGAALTHQGQWVTAHLTGQGSLLQQGDGTNFLDLRAHNVAGLLSVGAQAQIAGKFAAGATLAATDNDVNTRALVDGGVTIDNVPARASLSPAIQSGDFSSAHAVSLAGAVAPVGVNLSFAVNSSRAQTSTLIDDATILSSSQIFLGVMRYAYQDAFVLQGSYGQTAAIGAAVAITTQSGAAELRLDDATLIATGDVSMIAEDGSTANALAIGAAVGGTVGASGSVSVVNRDAAVRVIIDDSTVTSNTGDILAQAETFADLRGVGGGERGVLDSLRSTQVNFAGGGSVGIGVSVAILNTHSVTEALVTGDSHINARDTRAGGVPQSVGITGITRTDTATRDYDDRIGKSYLGFALIADNTSLLSATAITGAFGVQFAGAAQVPVIISDDTVTAAIQGSGGVKPEIYSGSGVDVFAGNETDVKLVSIIAAGGSAGVGADVESITLRGDTTALIDSATVTAKGTVTVQAITPIALNTVSASLAGGLYAGVSGIVQVAHASGTTLARIDNSAITTLNAGSDLTIRAIGEYDIDQTAVNVAAGIAGVGGSVVVLKTEQSVVAEIADSATYAARSVISVVDDVLVEAKTLTNVKSTVIGAAAGGVALNASVLVTAFGDTVVARLGDFADLSPRRADTVTVRATQDFSQDRTVGSASLGFAALGAAVNVTKFSGTVLAEIGDGANITAATAVTVSATADRDLSGNTIAAGGGLLALQGAVVVDTFGHAVDDAQTAEVLATLSRDYDAYSANGQAFDNGDAALAALIDQARATKSAVGNGGVTGQVAGDYITVAVNSGARIDVTGNLTLSASETGSLDESAGAAGSGLGAAMGGVAVVKRGSALAAVLGDGAMLTATGDVAVNVTATLLGGSAPSVSAFAAAGGLIGGAGAVADLQVDRSLSLAVGEGAAIDAGDELRLTITETAENKVQSLGGAAGGIVLGTTSATVNQASTLALSVDAGGADLSGNTVTLAVTRDGAVDAQAVGAAGGVLTGNAVMATAKDDSAASIDLGGATITADNAVTVQVANGAAVEATATGVAVGAGALGAAITYATRGADSAITGTAVSITADSVSLVAIDAAGEDESDASTVTTKTVSATGGAIGIGGAATDLVNSSNVMVDVAFASLTADSFRGAAVGNSALDAASTGVVAGVVALGANIVNLTDDLDVTVDLTFDQTATIDGTFTAEALATDVVAADVSSGMGGGFSANAAESNITARPYTAVTLSGAGGVLAQDIVLRTDRVFSVNNDGDSLAASLVGFGATGLTTTITPTSDITVDTALTAQSVGLRDSNAHSISLELNTTVEKLADGYNGQIGDAGLLTGSSLASDAIVETVGRITLQDGAVLTQTDQSAVQGGIDIAINQTYDLEDRMKIDTGGAILLPVANSTIAVDNTNTITLENAAVIAKGHVDLAITTIADVTAEVVVAAYGLAGSPGGSAVVDYDASQTIALIGASVESTAYDVTMAAGSADDGGQAINLNAETRILNGTGIPATADPYARSTANQTSLISVDKNSTITATNDITLTASGGAVDTYALWQTSNSYKELAEDIANLFGDLAGSQDDISLDATGGLTGKTNHFGVEVGGTVTAGARYQRRLHVGANGAITLQDDGIEASFADDVDAAAQYQDYLADLQSALAALPADPDPTTSSADDETRALLLAEIGHIQIILGQLGSGLVDTMTVTGIEAEVGDIIITSDYLRGNGSLIAHGNAEIEIINESARIIEAGNLVIPYRDGGKILFDGVSVENAADIAGLSAVNTQGEAAYFNESIANTLTVSAIDSEEVPPVLSIENRYAGPAGSFTGDILITGDIENLKGLVQLVTLDGSITLLGAEINAATVDIRSAGDFTVAVGLNGDLYHSGADPIGLYDDFITAYDDWYHGGQIGAAPVFVPASADPSAIIAGGNVYIYADTINVDGLIQSGITDFDLTIAAGFDDFLDLWDFGTETVTVYSPNSTAPTLGQTLQANHQPWVSGNVTLRYDPVTQQLIVDPVVAKGGNVELVGHIVSTGNGEISAASGYARIDIDSGVDVPLVFSNISTGVGEGAKGTITLTDLNSPTASGGYVTTTYTQNADGSVHRAVKSGGLLFATDLVQAEYEIDGNYLYVGNEGLYTSGTRTEIYTETRAQSDQSLLATSAGPVTVDVTAETPYTMGAIAEVSFAVADDYHDHRAFTVTGDEDLLSQTTLSEVSVDWVNAGGGKIAATEYTIEKVYQFVNQLDYDSHLFSASEPIAIAFHGYDSSRLNITAVGDVVLSGAVVNQAGVTTITADDGSILTTGAGTVLELAAAHLTAGGSIGWTSGLVDGKGNPAPQIVGLGLMQLDLQDGKGVEATAGGSIHLQELSGDMRLTAVTSTGGDFVHLVSSGDIRTSATASAGVANVAGGDITLEAKGGTIGEVAAPLTLSASGALTATAATSINLAQTGQDLHLNTVRALAGDIGIAVTGGSILDANDTAIVDRRADDGTLLALWDDIGVRGLALPDGSANARLADTIARDAAARTAEYHEYWRLRGIDPATGQARAFDPAAGYVLSQLEADQLAARGLSVVDIAAYQASQSARLASLHSRYGAMAYDATYVAGVDADRSAALTNHAIWSTGELGQGLSALVLTGQIGQTTTAEAANIIGQSVTLVASGGIGQTTSQHFLNTDGLTPAALAALRGGSELAVAKGVSFDVVTHDDIDVTATGTLTASAGTAALIGTTGSLVLDQVAAGTLARIDAAQGIAAGVAPAGQANVSGQNIVLNAGSGSIGALGAALGLAQTTGGAVTATAAGHVVLFAGSGDLALGSVLAGGDAAITALQGAIRDADASRVAVSGDTVALVAAGDIGASGAAVDVSVTDRAAGRLNALSTTGNLRLATMGDIAVGSVGARAGDVTLTVTDGDLTLANAFAQPSVYGDGQVHLIVQGGSVIGADGLATDLDAGAFGQITADVSGQFGTADRAIVIAGGTLDLSDMDTAAVLSLGDVTLGDVDMGGGDLALVALGDITLDGQGDFAASSASLDAAQGIDITGAVGFDGDKLDLTTNSTITLSGTGGLTSSGDTLLSANMLRIVNPAALCATCNQIKTTGTADLTVQAALSADLARVQAGGDLWLTATGPLGSFSIANALADTIHSDTHLGGVTFGQATAQGLIARSDLGGIDGALDIARLIDIETFGIGATDLAHPLTITARDTLLPVRLVAGIGVNVAFTGSNGVTLAEASVGTHPEGVIILQADGALTVASGGVTSGAGAINITAADLTLNGDIASAGGPVLLESTVNHVTQSAGHSVDAGAGAIGIISAKNATLADLRSTSADPAGAVTLVVGGTLAATGSAPMITGSTAVIAAHRIQGSAATPLALSVAGLTVGAETGAIHIANAGDLALTTAIAEAGTIDIAAAGDITLQGTVSARSAAITAFGGGISGRLAVLSGQEHWFNAFGGAIGLEIGDSRSDRINLGATGDVSVAAGKGDLALGVAISETGSVGVFAADLISAGLIGSATGARLLSQTAAPVVLATGHGQLVSTKSSQTGGVIRAADYRRLVAGAGAVVLSPAAGSPIAPAPTVQPDATPSVLSVFGIGLTAQDAPFFAALPAPMLDETAAEPVAVADLVNAQELRRRLRRVEN